MSYNNRRGTPNHTNIGTRRQTAAANFVPGGQLTPQKGGVQQNQQQQRGYGTQQQNKPQQQQQQQQTTQQKQSTPQQHVAPQQQQQQQHQQQQPSPQQPQWKPEEPVKSEGMENGSEQKDEKKKWLNRTKAPKKERLRRRNQRLGKLLQPKCAVMILNELVKNATFSVIDYVSTEGTQYKAVVNVDGVDHSGFGRSKVSAKNAAAETAIKYIFQNRKISPMNTSEISQDGTEKMDTGDEVVEDSNTLPWQQVASFALFKLFNSWGANPHVLKDDSAVRKTNPSKKMPENAPSLNPIMLLNQMYPHAKFEDLPQSGTAPNFVFNTKCSVDQQSFTGSGQTKKLAKKNVAFQVCHSLLGVQYAPEVFTPNK